MSGLQEKRYIFPKSPAGLENDEEEAKATPKQSGPGRVERKGARTFPISFVVWKDGVVDRSSRESGMELRQAWLPKTPYGE
jgi:hypothetical protein